MEQWFKLLKKLMINHLARTLKEGLVVSNKGIGVDRILNFPSFSDKDKEVLAISSELNIKTFFLSFCSSKHDIIKLRREV